MKLSWRRSITSRWSPSSRVRAQRGQQQRGGGEVELACRRAATSMRSRRSTVTSKAGLGSRLVIDRTTTRCSLLTMPDDSPGLLAAPVAGSDGSNDARRRLPLRLPVSPRRCAAASATARPASSTPTPAATARPAASAASPTASRSPSPADADAPQRARAAASRALAHWSPDRRDVALLVISELVTNAVRHGARDDSDEVALLVRRRGRATRIEVIDPALRRRRRRRRQRRRRSEAQRSGWGLPIVAELTDRWGVEGGPGRTCVWCELDDV